MKRILIAATVLAVAGAALARPVQIERNGKLLEFSFGWPTEAAATPALDRRFRGEMRKAFSDATANARADRRSAGKDKREFHRHEFAMEWSTAGQSQRLLSLLGEFSEFTGGAHPNHGSSALLWDRRDNREITIADLVTRAGSLEAVTRSLYCKALDQERLKRRNGDTLEGEFSQCPKYSELAIVPRDKDKDGRFDTVDFLASPYVAGPYVEGDYEVPLPVTRALIAAIKPVYRASFEAQRQ